MSETTRRRRRQQRGPLPQVTLTTKCTVEQVQTLWQAIMHDPLPYYMSDYTPREFHTLLTQLGRTVLLVMGMIGGEVAGGLFITRDEGFPDTRKPLHCIVDLFICERFRGRGTLPLTRAWKAYLLETLGFPTFYCLVDPDHKACHHLLGMMGMYRVGTVPQYLPRGGIARDVVLYSMAHPQEVSNG